MNVSTILTAAGLVSLTGANVLTAYGAHKATLKVEKIKQQIDFENQGKPEEEIVVLTRKDILKETWIDFVPAAAALAAGIACILVAKRMDAAKIAALASTAALLDEKLKLRDRAMNALEPADREKVQEILDKEVVKEAGTPPWDTKELALVDPMTVEEGRSGRKMICLESLSGQYFMSNPDLIYGAAASYNSRLASNGMVAFGASGTVSDWLDMLGLEGTQLFDALGWSAEHMLDVKLDTRLNDADQPVLVVNYVRQPKLTDDYLYTQR